MKEKRSKWKKNVEVALEQQKIMQTVFCSRCVWLIGKLSALKNNKKFQAKARQHYLKHVQDALFVMAEKDEKIITFKSGRK